MTIKEFLLTLVLILGYIIACILPVWGDSNRKTKNKKNDKNGRG